MLGLSEYFEGMPRSNFLSGKTDSVASTRRLAAWLQECRASHPACNSVDSDFLPTRLVDVLEISKNGKPGVRLIETNSGLAATYCCLSHCWGKVPISCCTTDQTLHQALGFLAFASLPKNFRDAIEITRAIGIRYIWIDSLCIIQKNAGDWSRESAKMAEIYRNAEITIVAASSADSTGGCFSYGEADVCFSIQPSSLSIRQTHLIGARMSGPGPSGVESFRDRYPVFFRGWVLQERLLSRRLAYFRSDELAFQCSKSNRLCECGNTRFAPHPDVHTSAHRAIVYAPFVSPERRVLMSAANKYRVKDPRLETDKLDGIYQAWARIVTEYKTLDLTNHSDILPALSGCAKVVQGRVDDEYVAGMWRRNLAQDLVWSVERDAGVLGMRNEPWTAPTWSWASLAPGQRVFFSKGRRAGVPSATNLLEASIREVVCEPAAPKVAPLGALKHAHLVLSAHVLPCYAHRLCVRAGTVMKGPRYRIYEQSGSLDGDECAPDMQGLPLRDGSMTLLRDTTLFHIKHEPVKSCRSAKQCLTSQVHLLRMEQKLQLTGKAKKQRSAIADTFMVLKHLEAPTAKVDTFERLGVVHFDGHSEEQRERWFREVWDLLALPQRQITLV
jgi:hypothetical protein